METGGVSQVGKAGGGALESSRTKIDLATVQLARQATYRATETSLYDEWLITRLHVSVRVEKGKEPMHAD